MFYSFVTLFGVLSQYFNSDPLRYCLLDTQVLRSGDLGKELLVSGLFFGLFTNVQSLFEAPADRAPCALCGFP